MRAKLTRFPILLAVTLTSSVSVTSLADELKTVRYSKEDLQNGAKGNFIQALDLSDVLAAKLRLLARYRYAAPGRQQRCYL